MITWTLVTLFHHSVFGCYTVSLNSNENLGNFMFQYAAMVGVCAKNNVKIESCANAAFNTTTFHNKMNFASAFGITDKECPINVQMSYIENRTRLYDSSVFFQPPGTLYHGYFQSYKYFHFVRESIQKVFLNSLGMINSYANSNIDLIHENLYNMAKGDHHIVCMVLDRSPYRQFQPTSLPNRISSDLWTSGLDYYYNAILEYHRKLGKVAIVIFSNEINGELSNEEVKWMKRRFWDSFQNSSITMIDGNTNLKIHHNRVLRSDGLNYELLMMRTISYCPHIIAGSDSSSWWSAYLSNHSNVIVPGIDVNPTYDDGSSKSIVNNYLSPTEYYPPSWKILSPNYQNLGSDTTTVITAYYLVPSKYASEKYKLWIRSFMTMNFKVLIFTDKYTAKYLKQSYPPTNRRR